MDNMQSFSVSLTNTVSDGRVTSAQVDKEQGCTLDNLNQSTPSWSAASPPIVSGEAFTCYYFHQSVEQDSVLQAVVILEKQ